MTTYRLRKNVRFPNGIWRYVYCTKRWPLRPHASDKMFKEFFSIWGIGHYQIVDSKGNLVDSITKSHSLKGDYRAIANEKGQPIIPDNKYDKSIHCVHCWHKGYEKGEQEPNNYFRDNSLDDNGDYENGFSDGYHFAYSEIYRIIIEKYTYDHTDEYQKPPPQPTSPIYQYQDPSEQSIPFEAKSDQYSDECIYCGNELDPDDEDSIEIYDEEDKFEGLAHESCSETDEGLE